jgi:hypothetical protein
MILLYLTVLNIVFADTVYYLNEEGDGVKTTITGNPYDPFYWINKKIAQQCNAYPTVKKTKDCWWIESGQQGCRSFAPSFSLYAISSINNSDCGNGNIADCISKIVNANLCAYSFWTDPLFMVILVFIIIMIATLITVPLCKYLIRRRASIDYHHPIEN